MRVLNIGSLNIDYVYRVDHISKPGETISSSSLTLFPGGKGANQSIALSRAGISVHHAGKVGEDGQWLLNVLQNNNVDISKILVGREKTGNALIQVSNRGENSIILFGGSNHSITREDVHFFLNDSVPGDYLLLQNEINNIEYIIEQAVKKKLKIVFNPAPMKQEVTSYPLHLIDSIILNEIEGAALSGVDSSAKMILKKLSDAFPDTEIILTLGEKGALYRSAGTELRQEAFPAIVKDTTAAGDTFIGYFLAARLCGSPIRECLKYGCQAASIAVSREGAMDSIPDYKEV
ncbi:MAG: ribokinase [Spirochaetales bacterium]|nr:ribokinase [Spirochaetales bacterium]